jgi:hypothetical protein
VLLHRNQLKQLVQLENVAEMLGFLDTLYGDMVKRYDNMLAEVPPSLTSAPVDSSSRILW